MGIRFPHQAERKMRMHGHEQQESSLRNEKQLLLSALHVRTHNNVPEAVVLLGSSRILEICRIFLVFLSETAGTMAISYRPSCVHSLLVA